MAIDAIVVDENGIRIKSFNEIRTAIAADYKSVFSDMNTEASSPDGMLIDLVAYGVMEVAQSVQSIYSNLDASTAQGVFLDMIANMAGLGGRLENEEDEALRVRILKGSHDGMATFENMLTYLRRYLGVGVNMASNENSTISDGMPPHSVVVFVPAEFEGENDFIAQKIWECKPAGIATSGSMMGSAIDGSGYSHNVYFSRVSSSDYDLKIELTPYSEESLPSDYVAQVKAAVGEWASEKMVPGKDIIPQRIVSAIYDKVDGIENIAVNVRASGSEEWSSGIVRVGNATQVNFPADGISVNLV